MRKTKLKYLADSITEKSKLDNEVLSLDKVESFTGKILDKTNEFSGDSFDGKKGDVVFAKIRPYLAKVACLNKDMNVFTTLMLLRPKDMNGRFLFWSLINQPFIDKANSLASGVTMPTIGWEQLKTLEIYVPDPVTQQRIAAFLDERTGKIDALVEEFAKFKANLQLQKRSLVSECVTKGLPSERDRAYKDSGVEWLGEVPASWEISKVKYVAKLTTGNTPAGKSDEYFAEAGTPWIRPSNLSDADIVSGEIIMLSNEGRNTVRLIPANSVAVVCIGATLGKIGLVDSEFATNQQINTLTYNDLVFYKYGFYFNLALHDEYVRTGMSVTLPIMNKTQHGNIIHLVPPLDEQQRIADYLDAECAKIDALIGEIDNQVNLLKTYRKSLINEVVTGKVEV
jgi:type I restriction enzyme S subunit